MFLVEISRVKFIQSLSRTFILAGFHRGSVLAVSGSVTCGLMIVPVLVSLRPAWSMRWVCAATGPSASPSWPPSWVSCSSSTSRRCRASSRRRASASSVRPRPPVSQTEEAAWLTLASPPDLLFLVTLTSSVCVVSEVIKMVERWRKPERRAPPTDCFHEV